MARATPIDPYQMSFDTESAHAIIDWNAPFGANDMTATAVPRTVMSPANRKFLAGGFVVLASIGLLVATGLQSASVYYLTVSEARAQLRPGNGQIVRVNGTADLGTVHWDSQQLLLSFDVVEGTNRIPVVFRGVLPDTFYQSESVVVEGTLSGDGVFQARTLLVKCPSRYEPVIAPSS